MHTYMYICLSSQTFLTKGVFFRGLLSGRFCPVWCLSVPLLSEYIHYNRRPNITFNFRFHRPMYEIFLKCNVTCSWTPSPLSQTFTPSRTPSQSSMTYFMDGPFDCDKQSEETGKFWNFRNQLIFSLG